MTRRRRFIGGLAGVIATSGLDAQTVRPAGRIGYLHPRTIGPDHPTLAILRPAWQRLGYTEGETVLLRSANDDAARLPALVAELISQGRAC